jgi:hypothetical protein
MALVISPESLSVPSSPRTPRTPRTPWTPRTPRTPSLVLRPEARASGGGPVPSPLLFVNSPTTSPTAASSQQDSNITRHRPSHLSPGPNLKLVVDSYGPAFTSSLSRSRSRTSNVYTDPVTGRLQRYFESDCRGTVVGFDAEQGALLVRIDSETLPPAVVARLVETSGIGRLQVWLPVSEIENPYERARIIDGVGGRTATDGNAELLLDVVEELPCEGNDRKWTYIGKCASAVNRLL